MIIDLFLKFDKLPNLYFAHRNKFIFMFYIMYLFVYNNYLYIDFPYRICNMLCFAVMRLES